MPDNAGIAQHVDAYTPKGLGTEVCWEWAGSRTDYGYGRITYADRFIYAHRAAWELNNQVEVGDTLVVRHTCDNPPCVNPGHLIPGTQADNLHDMVVRGRWSNRTMRSR